MIESADMRLASRLFRALVLGQKPNHVIAFVNGRCNLRCEFCCQGAKAQRHDPELSPKTWGQAFEGLDALVHLTITGGEPFLRHDLGATVAALVNASGVPRVSVNTNGWFVDRIAATVPAWLDEFPDLQLSLALSLDGTTDMHDSIRGRKGSADRVKEAVERLAPYRARRNFQLRLQSVLLPENLADLGILLDTTGHWPIDYHEIIFPRDFDCSTDVRSQLIETYRALTAKQLERRSGRFVRSVDGLLFKAVRNRMLAQLEKPGRRPCVAGSRFVEVFSDGRVVACEVGHVYNDAVLGSVADGTTLKSLLRSPAARKFQRERAANCDCTFECTLASGLVFNPSRWLSLWS